MRKFRDLKIWQKAHSFTLAIYKLTVTFPSEERFGMTSQIRRAAVSISNNIAEGCKRKNDTDFARFLNIAEGSVSETDYLLLLAQDLGYLSTEAVRPLAKEADEIGAMLYAFRTKIEAGFEP